LPEIADFHITATQDLIDGYITNLRRKYGNFINPETAGEEDYLSVKHGEENAQHGFFFLNELNDKGKKIFIGKKVDDTVTVSLKEIFAKTSSLSKFLQIKEEEIESENTYTKDITISTIGRIELAELNEEFYKKAYPDGSINSEEELKKVAIAAIEAEWEQESDRYFMNNAITTLMDSIQIELPDDFIKRYILHNNKEMKADELNEKYGDFKKSFKWQLVESKILKENNITVTEEDIKNHIRKFFEKNYFSNFNQEEIQDRLNTLVKDAMKNKEDVRNIYDQLVDSKMKEVFKAQMKVKLKTGDIQTFIEEINGGKNEKTVVKKTKVKKSTTSAEAAPEAPADDTATEPKAKPAARKPKTAAKSKTGKQ
ncbi:MAG: hypothetical protein LBK03_00770, partial [Bacteroidales bacterium]|nr:hypothetical protein [Bacteroidales bacterium]